MLSLFSWMSFKLINMTGRLDDFYIDVSNSSDGASAERCAHDGVPYKISGNQNLLLPIKYLWPVHQNTF